VSLLEILKNPLEISTARFSCFYPHLNFRAVLGMFGKASCLTYYHWLNISAKDSVKSVTFESYERLVRMYIVPALGRIKLKALTPLHIRHL
jgi:hypothetical protein